MYDLGCLPRFRDDIFRNWRNIRNFFVRRAIDSLLRLPKLPNQAMTCLLVADRLGDESMIRTSVESFNSPVLAFPLEVVRITGSDVKILPLPPVLYMNLSSLIDE